MTFYGGSNGNTDETPAVSLLDNETQKAKAEDGGQPLQ